MTYEEYRQLMERIATLERAVLEAKRMADKAMVLHDDFPDESTGGDTGSWPGYMYVCGKLFEDLTDSDKPYVKVIMSAVPSVEETDDDWPDPMPPNEEWFEKSKHRDPIHVTRFG